MPASARFKELTRLKDRELEALIADAPGPDPEILAGWIFRGFNTPFHTKLLGIQQFMKGMWKGVNGVEGYNAAPVQTGIDGECVERPSPEKPFRFGFFKIGRTEPFSKENRYPNSTLFNYGTSEYNVWCQPMKTLRDYVFQPDKDNSDLFIGKAYFAVGPLRIYSNFFIIERLRKVDWKPGA